jgi:hypothetical protein
MMDLYLHSCVLRIDLISRRFCKTIKLVKALILTKNTAFKYAEREFANYHVT